MTDEHSPVQQNTHGSDAASATQPGGRIVNIPEDMPPKPAKMETVDLTLYFGEKRVLNKVSLPIRANEITAVIGPSGCGKSSLLRCLNRLNDLIEEARVEGTVLLDGQDIYAEGVDEVLIRRRVGMIFQIPNPFPLSIFDNIAFGPRRHGITDRQRIAEIVEDCLRRAALWDEVKDILHQSALGLSGGQQQRLCLARLLAVEPEVILMDEPASALDPISAYRIEELMLQLKQRYTIVLVTRNMFQASRVADTTAVLMEGEIIEYGSTQQIFERPRDKRTDDYIRGRVG